MEFEEPAQIESARFGSAYLIGRLDSQPVYWEPSDDELLVEKRGVWQKVEMDERAPDEYLRDYRNNIEKIPLTDLGYFFAQIAPHRNTRIFTDRERVVYSLRDILDISRSDTAELLDVSPNTIDNQLSSAKKKITICSSVVDAIERKNDVRRVRVE